MKREDNNDAISMMELRDLALNEVYEDLQRDIDVAKTAIVRCLIDREKLRILDLVDVELLLSPGDTRESAMNDIQCSLDKYRVELKAADRKIQGLERVKI